MDEYKIIEIDATGAEKKYGLYPIKELKTVDDQIVRVISDELIESFCKSALEAKVIELERQISLINAQIEEIDHLESGG